LSLTALETSALFYLGCPICEFYKGLGSSKLLHTRAINDRLAHLARFNHASLQETAP
jgi:hypothetical protein